MKAWGEQSIQPGAAGRGVVGRGGQRPGRGGEKMTQAGGRRTGVQEDSAVQV